MQDDQDRELAELASQVDLTADDPAAALPQIAHVKKRAFLQAFAALGNVTAASKIAGISRRSHSLWMKDESADGELYRAAFKDAKAQAIEALETEARRRAMAGVTRKKFAFFQGGIAHEWEETEYSDTLLIFLLKSLKPETYRERQSIELTGKHGGPIHTQADVTQRIEQLVAILAPFGKTAPPQSLGSSQNSG